MKRRSISIAIALFAAILLTSTVFAGAIKFSNIEFRLGSFIVDGLAYGLGGTDWLVEVEASGYASVICTNHGSNDVPGQSSPHVDSSGTDVLQSDSPFVKKGKSPFTVIAVPEEELDPHISWDAGGCPNPNWTARIDFVYWETATISVKDPITRETIKTFNYNCTTTRIPQADGYTFDDGTVSCTEVK